MVRRWSSWQHEAGLAAPALWRARARRASLAALVRIGEVRSAAPLCPACSSRLCRWPSWVCACMPGTILYGVLVARDSCRYRLGCLDHSLSHHAAQRLLPDQPGSRPTSTSRAGASRHGSRSRWRTPLRLVDLAARHHRPGDTRHLVRKRHRRQPHRAPLQHPAQPRPGRTVPLSRSEHHGGGAEHQQPADFAVARLGDPPLACLRWKPVTAANSSRIRPRSRRPARA
jgi:hypothetical protein